MWSEVQNRVAILGFKVGDSEADQEILLARSHSFNVSESSF